MKTKIDTTEEKLLYREAMTVIEIVVWQDGCTFPVCPRCDSILDREYMLFCDNCGQRLKWKGFSKAKVRCI